MFPSRTTRFLLGAAVLLAALLAIPSQRHAGQEGLPSLPAVAIEAATRIQFVKAGQPTVIEKQDERWFLRQPLQAEADAASIRSLLRGFTKPIPMDLRVDQGNLEDYALDDSNNVTFELFAGGDQPALSFVIGKDLTGGSSLLRLRDGDAVFRARVGGRARFDREATDWRSRSVLDLSADQVVGLTLVAGSRDLSFAREVLAAEDGAEPTATPWQLVDDPGFPVDQPTVTGIVDALARLRASELHAPDFGAGWEDPAVRVEVALSGATVQRVALVPAPEGGAALARVEGREDVFRVAATWLERLGWPASEFRDKTVFSFSREQVDSIALQEGSHRVRIQQDLGTRAWRVVEPITLEADLRKTLSTVNALSDLRAARVSEGTEPRAAGLLAPRMRFEVGMIDGAAHVLEIGAAFQDPERGAMTYAWAEERLPIFELEADVLVRLRQAFLKN